MNFRTTYLLLGIVVVALAVLGFVVISSSDKPTNPSAEGYLLKKLRTAEVTTDKVTAVEIERPGQTPEKLAFVRDGRTWQMTAPARARVDSATVDSLVSGLLNAKTEKSADISSNPGAHGLDNPPVKVTVHAGDKSESLSLGNVTIGADKAVVYVLTADRPDKPQAARRSDFNALFKQDNPKGATNAGQLVRDVTDFRPLKLLGDGLMDPVNQVQYLRVIDGADEMTLVREANNVWRFRVPANYGEAETEADATFAAKEPKSSINSVRQLVNTIVDIHPRDRSQYIENARDLAKYGLDPTKNKPMQIDFTRDDGVKESIYVSDAVKTDAKEGEAKEGKADKVEKYYARHEADTAVAEVNATAVQNVRAALKGKHLLRDRTVLRVQIPRVDAIDIETNGEKVELRRVGLGWQVYDAQGKSRPVMVSAVTNLLNRLTSKQLATGFPPTDVPEDRRGFTKPAAEVKVWENGIVREEKADPNAKPKVTAPPTAVVQFGHKDVGDVVFTRRIAGESKADFFVPLDAFQLASRGRLDYLDPTLKPFGADAVLKLNFTTGKETYELERADDGKPAAQATWKINAPERLKGRAADSHKVLDLVNQLSFMRPTKVASDNVTDEVLNRLEVNPASPRMKVTAKVKEQGDRVFLFGGDAGTDKKTVYLKPEGEDFVFEVDRYPFDQFQKADIQDTVVHRIDKAKIKAVKITGWQEVLGSPTTLETERKDGKWTLKSGGMFELDPAKVDAFLNDLTTPRAEAFVVIKEGAKPEHNLDVAKNALVVVMTLEAGDPVTMTISPPNKDGKVFATTSALPGDVFTLPDRFATVRAKPAALKKD
jgi:Domain of unknown function (DUF4340)